MNKAITEAIGKTLGTIEQVNVSTTNINQPLCHGRMVNIEEADLQQWCSTLNHVEKYCTLWTESGGTLNIEKQQYVAWLCAPMNNLQKPQVANNKVTPKTNPPPPWLTTPPSSNATPRTNDVSTKTPLQQSIHPDLPHPTIPEI
ncbi:hypothetical protein CFP56_013446, partial [Quercus suber]